MRNWSQLLPPLLLLSSLLVWKDNPPKFSINHITIKINVTNANICRIKYSPQFIWLFESFFNSFSFNFADIFIFSFGSPLRLVVRSTFTFVSEAVVVGVVVGDGGIVVDVDCCCCIVGYWTNQKLFLAQKKITRIMN